MNDKTRNVTIEITNMDDAQIAQALHDYARQRPEGRMAGRIGKMEFNWLGTDTAW